MPTGNETRKNQVWWEQVAYSGGTRPKSGARAKIETIRNTCSAALREALKKIKSMKRRSRTFQRIITSENFYL